MRYLTCFVRSLAVAVALSLVVGSQAEAIPMLTGLIEFSTDASGNVYGDPAAQGGKWLVWNTSSPNYYNLYVTQTALNGAFVNSGNGPETGIAIALPVGTHTFFIFGDHPPLVYNYNSSAYGQFGLNLFFNGGLAPGVSVRAPTDTSSSSDPAFEANGAPTTLALAGPSTNTVGGAGTLTFAGGDVTVTLTDYHWSAPSVENVDRVQPYSTDPSGRMDWVGSFTLEVTDPPAPVPEPATLLLLGSGLWLAGLRAWKRRKSS